MDKSEIEKKLKVLAKRANIFGKRIFIRIDNHAGFFVLLNDNFFYWKYAYEDEDSYCFTLGSNRDTTICVKTKNIITIDVDAGRIEIVL